MNAKQRAAMYAWIELIGQYGGQDGQWIYYCIEPDGTLTVDEEGLVRKGDELIVSGSAGVSIDLDGIVRTLGGHEVEGLQRHVY